jgi:hypothetical protein
MYKLRYNPDAARAAAAQHFMLLGVAGGYGETRANLVRAVLWDNHVRATALFNQLVQEGLQDDVREGLTCSPASGMQELCKHILEHEPLYAPFVQKV